jgi:hypothetical protein
MKDSDKIIVSRQRYDILMPLQMQLNIAWAHLVYFIPDQAKGNLATNDCCLEFI